MGIKTLPFGHCILLIMKGRLNGTSEIEHGGLGEWRTAVRLPGQAPVYFWNKGQSATTESSPALPEWSSAVN